MTSRSLWNYYRNEVSHSAKKNKDENNFRIKTRKRTANMLFECKHTK